jgi:hypothetical protein
MYLSDANEVQHLKETIAQREQEITTLQMLLDEQKKENANEVQQLKETIAETEQNITALQMLLDEQKKEIAKLHQLINREISMTVDVVVIKEQRIPGLFKFYTGLTYAAFCALLTFILPSGTMQYSEKRSDLYKITDSDGLLLTLARLRQRFALKDIGARFGITAQTASVAFNDWVNLLYMKLSQIPIWPERNVIIQHMPEEFRLQFPTCLCIIDGTEIRTEVPSSPKLQSQMYSEYKSSTTLKALVACDPRGGLLFTSELFTGSISDKALTRESGFLELLKKLKAGGYVHDGDAIMADKGFIIEDDLAEMGIMLNIPPFTSSTAQMTPAEIAKTNMIATHRIHVERLISSIKKFKLVSGTVPLSLLSSINKLWAVASLLTLFQNPLIKP